MGGVPRFLRDDPAGIRDRRDLEPNPRRDPVFQAVVAEVDGEVIGFANLVLHDFTWSDSPACLLHDLYVQPDRRGHGAGRALIQHCVDRGEAEGWNRVYWLTKEDNVPARRLYDTFGPADGFIRYRLTLPIARSGDAR